MGRPSDLGRDGLARDSALRRAFLLGSGCARPATRSIASGTADPRLEPFRADRFERGELLAASKGPYPWT